MSQTPPTLPYNWHPRDYQIPLWNTFLAQKEIKTDKGEIVLVPDYDARKKRAVCVWHRRCGKDLTAFNIMVAAAHESVEKRTFWHAFPHYGQGKRAIWDGIDGTGRRFLDYIPPEYIAGKNSTEMKIEFTNGSIYQVVGVNEGLDKLRGTNPYGVILSEWGDMNPKFWQLILRPILTENGGWAAFIYTPKGKNHGYDMWCNAVDNPDKWYSSILTVDTTLKQAKGDDGALLVDEHNNPVMVPLVTPEDIQEMRNEGITEERIQQEFFCSFDSALEGNYYASHIKRAYEENRIATDIVMNEDHVVHTAWDLGVADKMCIWFFQVVGAGEFTRSIVVFDYEEMEGKGLLEAIKIVNEKGYNYGKHLAPHDIMQRELTSAQTRLDTARKNGLIFTVVPKSPVLDGIDRVRSKFSIMYINERNCKDGLEALKGYVKRYSEEKQMYEEKPHHNWASHGADAFRTLVMGLDQIRERKPIIQKVASSHYKLL